MKIKRLNHRNFFNSPLSKCANLIKGKVNDKINLPKLSQMGTLANLLAFVT